MLNRIFKSVILGACALVVIGSFSSCKKEKETIGVIIVQDYTGSPVDGAYVTLHQDGHIPAPDPSIKRMNVTDANGRAEFTYELEAILQVDVIRIRGNDTLQGSNVIRLLKEKTVTKIVEVYTPM